MPALLPLTRAEAEKYAGQWVAIKDDTVIRAALSAEELLHAVQDEKLEPDLVARIPAPGEPQSLVF